MRRSIQVLAFALLAVSMASAQIPTNGLVAWYPFTGNANDASGNGNNGTVSGAFLTTDRFGNPNSAYSFNGTNSVITVTSPSNLSGLSSLSISLWVKPLGIQTPAQGINDVGLISKDRTSPSSIAFCINLSPNNRVSWGVNNDSLGLNNGFNYSIYGDSLAIGVWSHVVCTWSGSSMSIYSNGIKIKDTTGLRVMNLLNTNNPLNIGKFLNSYCNASIDDIRLYNRFLSQSEITALYDEGTSFQISINKTGFPGSPASFSVDSTFNSVVATFNTSVFSTIDTLYLCYETANLTYLTQRTDRLANYSVNIGGPVADFGNNISTGTFSPKAVNITALKAISANYQVTFNYTGGGGEIIFANPYLLVYGTKSIIGSVQKVVVRPQSLMKASVFPNPIRTSATINYSVPFLSPLDISIYDANGKIIKNVFRGLKQPGVYNYVWDGTNISGASVANGNYFFRVRAAKSQQISEQIVVLK